MTIGRVTPPLPASVRHGNGDAVRLAIHNPNFTVDGGDPAIASTLAATVRTAEEGGVHTFTVMDHWFQMESMGDPRQPMLEGYTTLGWLAAQTERMRLGLLVTGVTYRYPGLLAKILATLDVLSGGRAMLGIGAAWYEQEHTSLGVPYPPLTERFRMLEEAILIARQMWSDDDGPFTGEHFRLGATVCQPKPLHRIPILIGGQGEKKTLRLVAEHGDACNLFDIGPDGLRHKLDVLQQHCDAVGRDIAEIERTTITQFDPSDVGAFLQRMEQYAALGISTVWISAPRNDDPAGWVARAAEQLVPRLADLPS